jgi:hypothetical protein
MGSQILDILWYIASIEHPCSMCHGITTNKKKMENIWVQMEEDSGNLYSIRHHSSVASSDAN